MTETKHKKTGFTLLELLIVIAIIAILSVILIIVINPAETLKKSRDVQRLSDLGTLKTAVGLLLTSSSTPYIGGLGANTLCEAAGTAAAGDKIWYSLSSDSDITDATLDGYDTAGQVAAADIAKVDGTGWIPINFAWLPGGAPISNLPLDPVNSVAALATVANTDLVYRYACDSSDLTFELGAVLESTAYTSDDDKMQKDGGNNDSYYEAGTKLTILDGATNPY